MFFIVNRYFGMFYSITFCHVFYKMINSDMLLLPFPCLGGNRFASLYRSSPLVLYINDGVSNNFSTKNKNVNPAIPFP